MDLLKDKNLLYLLGVILALLLGAQITVLILTHKLHGASVRKALGILQSRLLNGWGLCIFTILILASGPGGVVLLFALLSLLALWQFTRRTPAWRRDLPALLWGFVIALPLQYYFVDRNWYALFVIFIPIFSLLLVTVLGAMARDGERLLERTSRLQWGLMVEVYFLSHAPALLLWEVPESSVENSYLFLFFLLVAELSDACQELVGKTAGTRQVSPRINSDLTWEGLLGALGAATLAGWGLARLITPFKPQDAILAANLIAALGFFGRLCFRVVTGEPGAVPPDPALGRREGFLERLVPVCFAAPFFFHFVRFFFAY